ncbi:MAG TPA: sensor histidine kinase [Candidatus Limnocylindria bacterium]|nr:sensor histidine kinase [Candidatus Limnocylindria bacterium]
MGRPWRLDLRTSLVAFSGVAMLAVAGASLAYRAAGPSDGSHAGYVTSAVTRDGVEVTRLPGQPTALEDGDRVEAIDGVPLESWLRRGPSDRPSVDRGDRATYDVARDGRAAQVAVRIGQYPLGRVLLDSWGTVIFLLVTLGVTAYVFVRRPSEPATRPLLLLGTGLVGSTIPWMLGLQPLDLVTGTGLWVWFIGSFVVYSVFWSASLHFSLVFPRRIGLVRRIPAVTWLVYAVPLALLLAWALVGVAASGSAMATLGSMTGLQLLMVLGTCVSLVAAQVVQYRTAGEGSAREQTRWLAWGGISATVLVVAFWFGPELVTGRPTLPWSAVGLPGLLFTGAIAVAVLRHRLFDIDVVINRTLVYGTLTASVAATYFVGVLVLRSVMGTDANFAVSLLATGAAALLALPIRDALQRGVNRLMYGDRDDPYRAITRLGERLGSSLTTEEVLPTVVATVATALRLPYVAIELRQGDVVSVAASTGSPPADADAITRLPLVDRGETIGDLAVAARGPGERFSRADHALLAGLAQEAGRAARSVRLAAELDRSRRQLVAAREEERRRLRRDLHDGLGPTLAAARLKVQAVRAGAADPSVLDQLDGELAGVLGDVRRISRELRPPALDELGLMPALRAHAARFAVDGELTVQVDGPGDLPALPAAVESAAYLIAMEALTNVRRHSGAVHCRVRVRLADALELEIEDDGAGLAAEPEPGVGLASMRERAAEVGGSVTIGRGHDAGTLVLARLPLTAPSGGAA